MESTQLKKRISAVPVDFNLFFKFYTRLQLEFYFFICKHLYRHVFFCEQIYSFSSKFITFRSPNLTV